METVNYLGWKNSIRLANHEIELIILADVGPRVIRYGLLGGPNEFHVEEQTTGRTGDSEFHTYGGHRLWHAPEDPKRTYQPDNQPVKVEEVSGEIHLLPPPESAVGVQKEWFIRLDPNSSRVTVRHQLRNIGLWPVHLAPWALSVMASGGVGILPLPPRGDHQHHLLPTGNLSLWAYTNMEDPRWTWGEKYILLRQDRGFPLPQKIGSAAADGWAAYANRSHLFVKFFSPVPGGTYPDFGSSVEFFTNSEIFEVETLGILSHLEPGAAVTHTEDWFLYPDVNTPRNSADVERNVLPKIEAARKELAARV